MLNRNSKYDNNSPSMLKYLYFGLILVVTLFIVVDIRIRPLIIEKAKYKVQTVVTQAVNEAIIEEMEKTPLSYGDLITVSRDESGDVSLLSYNALEVNRLKSQINTSVIQKVAQLGDTDINIPIANITNIDYLHNKGPELTFTITPVAFVETDIESDFEYTGINQVNHRIFIVLKITASALIPNYSANVYFETKVCVAQTVIIGKVPENIGNNLGYFGQ